MQKLSLIKLTPILLILFGATLTFSQDLNVTPMTPSAASSPQIPVAQDGDCDTVVECRELLRQANARVIKLVADLKASIDAGTANEQVKVAYRQLIDLMRESMAVKDQMIADVMADNDFLRKDRAGKSKSWLRRTFEVMEKVALIALGAYLAK